MIDSLIIVRGNGPILITGPHSHTTVRNKKEIHHQEEYIYDIVHKLYKLLGPKLCTIMTWNIDFLQDANLYPSDPNFVQNIEKSIWFKQLKNFKRKKPKFYLHLDVHGMKNNSTKNHIELGMKAIQLHRPGLSQHMKPVINEQFKNLGVPFSFNSHFQGWGMNKYTVSNQGVLLGFFSIQLEISTDIRKRIKNSNVFTKKFVKVVREIYKKWKEEMKKPEHHKKTIKCIKKKRRRRRRNKTKKKQ